MKKKKQQLTPKKYEGIVKKYYEKLHVNKLDSLDGMDKFLETYNLPKINQEESENLNRQIITSEIEEVIKKKLPIKKFQA